MKQPPLIVSACLLGIKCRYDGTDAANETILDMARTRCLIPLCPEQLGGLPTPRAAAEIENGNGGDVLDGSSRVISGDGSDVTPNFTRGAAEILKVVRLFDISEACLKEKSPSCGVTTLSGGGDVVKGVGVTTALLIRSGVRVSGVN